MIGQKISHYKINSKLGEGGMGVVYKAEDTKLKREVAIKFLPHHIANDSTAIERFKIEARAAAALNHPNIATIHTIEEADDETFIVMEYVNGQSLKEKIESGPFEINEALDISIQISQGLSKAHEKGITHRDIKPSNIVVSDDGIAKILDFGLAKIAEGTIVTKEGTTLGTAAYMSPEQARGEPVDHRTDIWSLGVVMYEMLERKRPFKGEYEQAMVYSILNTEPEPMSDVPADIESIVYKALEKNPDERYQSAGDMLEDLRKAQKEVESMVSKAETKEEKSIIVLPFVNMSPDPEQEYFSDGLTEEIITDLSHIHDLLVISRSSAMTFKGSKKKIKEIAKEVNIRYVLEGSVRKAGNNLRITAQLIDAATDAHLWAEKYIGTLDDVFDIQEKVSRSIVDALKLNLTAKEDEQIAERPIDNVKAYECYLRARNEIWSWTEDGLNRALQLIQNGMKLFGENELFYAALGIIYNQFFDAAIDKDISHLEKAEEYAKKIFELNPDSSEGHVVLGYVYYNQGKVKEAAQEEKRALEINPNNIEALYVLGCWYSHLGRPSAGRPLIKKAIEIDPLNPVIYGFSALVEMYDGKFKIALEATSKMYSMKPENPFFRLWHAHTLAYNNQFKEAYEIIDIIVNDTPQSIWAQSGLFLKYALQGDPSNALNSVTEELKNAMKWNTIYPIAFMAEQYAMINEKEEGLNWLEYGINYGCINYPFLNEYDPFLENIRGEERFKKLMQRVKYEWENFEV